MDLIFKNTTFSLKIDWYRRASTVHHCKNKQKLAKISSNKKNEKRSFSFIGGSRKNRAHSSCVRGRAGGPFLVIFSDYTSESAEDSQTENDKFLLSVLEGFKESEIR